MAKKKAKKGAKADKRVGAAGGDEPAAAATAEKRAAAANAAGSGGAKPAGGRRTSVTAQVRSSRKRRQQRVNIAVGAGLATVIVTAIAVQVVREVSRPGQRFPSLGNLHLASINTQHVPYNSDPPTSGPHMPTIAACGSYTEPIADEYLVHNMEDAGVVIWYEMGTPEENAENVAALEQVARGYRRVIIVPREDLGSKYALTAWQRLQRFDEIDEAAMRRFIEAYEGIDHHPR